MTKKRSSKSRRIAAIEIGGESLHLAMLDSAGHEGGMQAHTRCVEWQEEAVPPHSDVAIERLCHALKKLVHEAELEGGRVSLTFNGDYCVTRVATGTTERVRREMAELEERSGLYLTLGPGAKSLAGYVHALDARHQHGLLSVINRKILDAMVRLSTECGLTIELIEPSLVALSRIVGHTGRDQHAPVLIVSLSRNGVEMGISHRGNLLLDYRPGGKSSRGEVVEIVSKHLKRLRRYCDRYYRHAEGRLETVLIFGDADNVQAAREEFEQRGELNVEVMDPRTIETAWTFENASAGSEICAALGTCLVFAKNDGEFAGPNLMERFRAENREPMWTQLRRTAWPIAAVLLLSVVGFLTDLYQRSRCTALQRQLDRFAPARDQMANLDMRLRATRLEADHLERLDRAIVNPAWNSLLTMVAGCLPEEVWLDRFECNSQQQVRMGGISYSDDSVYEFVRWLNEVPWLEQVVLEGTQAVAHEAHSAMNFDVACEIVSHAEGSERTGSDD